MSKTAESSQAATFTIQNKTDQTNTATWKTYSNPQYAFIFKYPQNWVMEDEGCHEGAGQTYPRWHFMNRERKKIQTIGFV